MVWGILGRIAVLSGALVAAVTVYALLAAIWGVSFPFAGTLWLLGFLAAFVANLVGIVCLHHEQDAVLPVPVLGTVLLRSAYLSALVYLLGLIIMLGAVARYTH